MPEPIQIVIKRTDVSGQAQTQQQAQASDEQGKPKIKDGAVMNMLVNYGKQAMQNGIAIYTALSGNTNVANALSDLTTIAGDVSSIVVGGWVGVANVAISKTTTIANALVQQSIQNARLNFIKDQMGNAASDGNRGWMR